MKVLAVDWILQHDAVVIRQLYMPETLCLIWLNKIWCLVQKTSIRAYIRNSLTLPGSLDNALKGIIISLT